MRCITMKNIEKKISLQEFKDIFQKYSDIITEKLLLCFEKGLGSVMNKNETTAIIFSEEGYTISVSPRGDYGIIPFSTLLELSTELIDNGTKPSEIYNSFEIHFEKPDETEYVFSALVVPKYTAALFKDREIIDIMIVTIENGLGFAVSNDELDN